jgi:hypothetical protein
MPNTAMSGAAMLTIKGSNGEKLSGEVSHGVPLQ